MNGWNTYLERLESGLEPDPDSAPLPLLHVALPSAVTLHSIDHLDLESLRLLASQHKSLGASFELPSHLSGCPDCLDAFLALLDGPTPLTALQTARYLSIWDPPRQAVTRLIRFPLLRWAAAAAALLLIAYLSRTLVKPLDPPQLLAIPVHVETGSLVAISSPNTMTTSSRPSLTGTFTASREMSFSVAEPSRIILPNGVHIQAERDTTLVFLRTAHETTVDIQQGDMTIDVAPQPSGHTVKVQTPLGVIRVIGTRFQVICNSENAVEYLNDGIGEVQRRSLDIASITIRVHKGTVAIQNPTDEVRVTAGQRAVLRAGQQHIDVGSDTQ